MACHALVYHPHQKRGMSRDMPCFIEAAIVSKKKFMPITYTWDYLIGAYTSLFEQTKNSENEGTRSYANHALGMLSLIPQIRDFPEFKEFELDMSLTKLVCISKSTRARVYLACEDNFVYMETYQSESGHSGMNKFNLEQFLALLPQVLKQLSGQ
jgi:hypothetical protein